jgi:hypothetical protein
MKKLISGLLATLFLLFAGAAMAAQVVVSGGLKITGTAGTDGIIFPDASKQTTAFDTGCPGPVIGGICVIGYNNTQTSTFLQSALICASLDGDLCTSSQAWPLTVGAYQNIQLGQSLLHGPHWLADFSDNDSSYWSGANGGTADDHPANTSYGYVCCGGYTPAHVPVSTINNVTVTAIHDVADTYWSGAVAYCSALRSDICSDSQTLLIRDAGNLTVATWTNSHSDNDGSSWNIVNGGTADDTNPATNQYGFACCASNRPSDLSCPVARTAGVCAVAVHNVVDSDFRTAATACASQGADLCSTAQSAVLRTFNLLTVSKNWTNSASDNDAGNAAIGVGSSMPDNPTPSTLAGYACCLN